MLIDGAPSRSKKDIRVDCADATSPIGRGTFEWETEGCPEGESRGVLPRPPRVQRPPDHVDHDHGHGRLKDGGRTAGTGTSGSGTAFGTAGVADMIAAGEGSHDANGICRP
jgi:hypothetical protein